MRTTSTFLAATIAALLLGGRALAAENLKGEVLGGGAPIADATVTLWAAGEGAPKELGRARTDAQGRFDLGLHHSHGGEARSIWWPRAAGLRRARPVGTIPPSP